MQALAANFVPVADEVHRLQHRKSADCLFFQGFMEEGHYGGRTQPTDTRQGIYAVTPAGGFLASVNTQKASAMVRMLETALARWKELEPEQRLGPELAFDEHSRFERFFPEDGLVLRCVSRDLDAQEELRASDWRRTAWNQDFAWFRKSEMLSLIPEAKVGAQREMPEALVQRLAQCHLLDNVRGQTPPYDREQVEQAQLTLEVIAVEDGALHLRLEGRSRAQRPRPGGDEGQTQGLECELRGRAEFDGERFTRFELVAVGRRWGGTTYNARGDQGESRLGIALVLDERAPRVAPANHWRYGWR